MTEIPPQGRVLPEALRVFTAQELAELQPPSWFVEDFVQEGALSLLYGPPGAGKSLLALELATAVSLGGRFVGRQAEQGSSLYLWSEGRGGFRSRLMALMERRYLEDWPHNLRLVTSGPTLRGDPRTGTPTPGQLGLAEVVEAYNVKFLVVDTLINHFGGGSENNQEDMANFTRYLQELPCAVLVIHHSPVSTTDRPRGSSVLWGACDTVLRMTQNQETKIITLSCKKQKDWDPFPPIKFQLEKHVFPATEDYPEARSVTLKYVSRQEENDKDVQMYGELREQGLPWASIMSELGWGTKRMVRARDLFNERNNEGDDAVEAEEPEF
jgi:hypothetical protein